MLLPSRVYDLVDVGFNAIAAFMAICASVFMAWALKWDLVSRLRRKSDQRGRRTASIWLRRTRWLQIFDARTGIEVG